MELICAVQSYAWGKRGDTSLVALIAGANRNEAIRDIPYAELWMGVHPSGPSVLKKTNESLLEHLKKHPEQLGQDVSDVFAASLPFLFKVLSVETALSIQAHPAKSHAEQLFLEFPDVYKDPNHKPELAIALSEFEALCGFRPRQEIQLAVTTYIELQELLDKEKVETFLSGKDDIRGCFEALMTSSAEQVKKALSHLINRPDDTDEIKLLRRLNGQFPGDVGCLCVFWLNYLVLSPGEALFLAPNEPHAYISGSCVECMANSDNVVRAGLTPKFRDTTTLCQMLTYKSYEPAEIKFQPLREDQYTLLYEPPVRDFAVAKITLPEDTEYKLLPRKSASILLTTSGKAAGNSVLGDVQFKIGCILFLPANTSLTVSTADSDLVLFQALCNM